MPGSLNRRLPAIMAIGIGVALRSFPHLLKLMKAFIYLRPALIKQRDERERQALAKQVREETNSSPPTIESQEPQIKR